MKTVTKLLPGCALALVIAAIAKLLESLEASAGLHLIGASVIALFIGMLVNHFYKPNDATKPGIRFTSKKILKFAIILLGASLNITTVLTVGKFSLTVMLFTLATCFGLGYFIGKALGLNWKTSRDGQLRRLCHRGHCARYRRDRYGHCLRLIGDLPVRHGDGCGLPDSRAKARAVRRRVRALGRHCGQRHLQRCCNRLRLQ